MGISEEKLVLTVRPTSYHDTRHPFTTASHVTRSLQKATSEEQRAKYPWIITMAHHPMYCSTTDEDDCNHRDSVVSCGWMDWMLCEVCSI